MLGLQVAVEKQACYSPHQQGRLPGVTRVELPACPWNWSQEILTSFKFSYPSCRISEDLGGREVAGKFRWQKCFCFGPWS